MSTSTLKGFERALLDRRAGVPRVTLALLQRAVGLDLLVPEEYTNVTVTKLEVPQPNGTVMELEFSTEDKLFFPVPGFRGGLVPDQDGTMYYPAS